MRLININTMKIEEATRKEHEQYAILSHRWGDEEVLYHHFTDIERHSGLAGWNKVELTAAQAKEDGLEYIWIDTCCIDKTSSAELSEAINSMFKWYQGATVCYVYLDDVETAAVRGFDDWRHPNAWSHVATSKWFTRGWTLQELIAPRELIIYTKDWSKIGTKRELVHQLGSATGIDRSVLENGRLDWITVAKKMSWASNRKTTREEDIAYCLMGIFDINMPMLYGEGSKAFIRLQEEIIKESDDPTILAWRAKPEEELKAPFRGTLAVHPREFVACRDIVRDWRQSLGPWSLTNKGLQITSVVTPKSVLEIGERIYSPVIMSIGCTEKGKNTNPLGIALQGIGGNQYVRVEPSKLFWSSLHVFEDEKTIFTVKNQSSLTAYYRTSVYLENSIMIQGLPDGARISMYPPDTRYDGITQIIEAHQSLLYTSSPDVGYFGPFAIIMDGGTSQLIPAISIELRVDYRTRESSFKVAAGLDAWTVKDIRQDPLWKKKFPLTGDWMTGQTRLEVEWSKRSYDLFVDSCGPRYHNILLVRLQLSTIRKWSQQRP